MGLVGLDLRDVGLVGLDLRGVGPIGLVRQMSAGYVSLKYEKATEVDQLRTKTVGFFSKIKLKHHQYSNKRSFKILVIHVPDMHKRLCHNTASE